MDNSTQALISHNIIGDNARIHQGNVDIANHQGDVGITSTQGQVQISCSYHRYASEATIFILMTLISPLCQPLQELKLDYLPATFDAVSRQHVSGCLQHTREQVL